ncbi:MAG TPA: response regulator [Gaiellaceae bacterium]|jgi:DNA-binding NtrC family response regulator
MVSVLLIEDDSLVRHVVTTMLEVAGHQVVGAGSPREARAAVAGAEAPFDLIVADVRLPELPGPELVAELRLLQPTARCLYISGYGYDEAAEYAELDGPFLPKPFTGNDLNDKIDLMFD